MIQTILHTTQDLKSFQEPFKFGFRPITTMVDNTYLLWVDSIEQWDLLHLELVKNDLHVIGIWNKDGEFLTDDNVTWKDEKDKDKKKESKNKFVKSEYKSKLKQIEVVNELIEKMELIYAPEDMQVSKISGWNNRVINTDE